MLILTRRIGQVICVGDEIKVVILNVRGSQVRIGIQAPVGIPVYREEIYNRIQDDKVVSDADR